MLAGRETIVEIAEQLAANIEAGAESELALVDGVMVIASVSYGHTDDGDAETGSLFYRCSSARPHIQLGLLRHTERAIDLSLAQEREDGE